MARTKQVSTVRKDKLGQQNHRATAPLQPLAQNMQQVRPAPVPRPSRHVSGGVMRPHRYRPGTVALREIRKYQKSTDQLVPMAPFKRLVQSTIAASSNSVKTINKKALEQLKEEFETTGTRLLELANKIACHHSVQTIRPKDLIFAAEMLGLVDVPTPWQKEQQLANATNK